MGFIKEQSQSKDLDKVVDVKLELCDRNDTSCYLCDNDRCLRTHNRDLRNDCPKWLCDKDGDCENCQFIKQLIKELYHQEI